MGKKKSKRASLEDWREGDWPKAVGQKLHEGHKGSGAYRFLRGPSEAHGSEELLNANANALPANRGMGQTVVDEIDYLEHLRHIRPCQFTKAQRQDYRNRSGPLSREVTRRREVLKERLRRQRIREYQDYRARLYGEGEPTPPKRYELRRWG